MNEKIKKIIKTLFKKHKKYGFFGNYKNWQQAVNNSSGYDSQIILEKVKNSLTKVKNGQAVYERDSVLFSKVQYSWAVLSSLLWISSQKDNRLNLIDFGGSLGSSYFQNRELLKHLKDLKWNIVEQKSFMEYGKKYFEDENLKFYESIDECLNTNKPDLILISSSIQYLEEPYIFIEKIISYEFEYIIFDRTTFLKNEDRLTVQKVPPSIYDASYPAWFLNETKFLKLFKEKYKLISDFDSLAGKINLEDATAFEKGFIFKKI